MKRIALLTLLFASVAVAAAACGAFGGANGSNDDGAKSDAGSDAAPTPQDAGAVVTEDASTPEDAGGPSCTTESFPIIGSADALLSANSDQAFGNAGVTVCNPAIGECAVRFVLGSAQAAKFKANKIVSAKLTLYGAITDPSCVNGDAGGCDTTTFRRDGTMNVSPLRSDWPEDDVSWVRRNKTMNLYWNDGGANKRNAAGTFTTSVDRGNVVGTVSFVAKDALVEVPLGAIDVSWLSATNELSFVVETPSPADYTFVSHRAKTPTDPLTPPTLTLVYCK